MPKPVKIRKMVKTVKNEHLEEMFNKTIGAGNCEVDICFPKYLEIKKILDDVRRILTVLSKSKFISANEHFAQHNADLNRFIEELAAMDTEYFHLNLYDAFGTLTSITEDQLAEFTEAYKHIKESQIIHALLATCNNLSRHRDGFRDQDKLSSVFILNIPGISWEPIDFAKFNMKYIFTILASKEGTESIQNLILLVLFKLYNLTMALYRIVTSPDVDIEKFVDIVLSNLDKLRAQIPRCDKAFRKLEESVELLKKNFGSYYKDFYQSKDSSVIMQNFIVDVSKSTKGDPDLMRQFRSIIQHYQKVAGSQVNDPRVKQLMNMFYENMDNYKKYEDIDGSDSDGDNDGDEAPTSETHAAADDDDHDDSLHREREANLNKTVDELVDFIEK